MLDTTGAGVLYTGAELSMQTFQLLMGAGAPIDCYSRTGEHHAYKAILSITREHSVQNDQMVALVNAGLDLGLRQPNRSSGSPLPLALMTKNFRLAELLIKKGCSLFAVNNQGQSLLYFLADHRAIEWVLDLAPVLVDQRDRNGQTPLLAWVRRMAHNAQQIAQCLGPIQTLIEQGANLDAFDHQGLVASRTPRQIMGFATVDENIDK